MIRMMRIFLERKLLSILSMEVYFGFYFGIGVCCGSVLVCGVWLVMMYLVIILWVVFV